MGTCCLLLLDCRPREPSSSYRNTFNHLTDRNLSGINLAFTRLAASHGAKCIIADLRLTQEAEEYMKTAKGVVFAKCDVTKWADLQNLITVSQKEFGDVPDIYVAGAGVFEPVRLSHLSDTITPVQRELRLQKRHY